MKRYDEKNMKRQAGPDARPEKYANSPGTAVSSTERMTRALKNGHVTADTSGSMGRA